MKRVWDIDLQLASFFFFWCGHNRASSPRTTLRESHRKKKVSWEKPQISEQKWEVLSFSRFLLFSVDRKYRPVSLNMPTISTKLPFVQIRPRLCLYCSLNFSSCFHGCARGEFIVYLCRQGVRYVPSELLIRTENSWDKLKEKCFVTHLSESITEWSLHLKDTRLH